MNRTASELPHRVQANEISAKIWRTSHNKRADYNSACDVKETLNEKTDGSFRGSNERGDNVLSKNKSMANNHELESIKGHTPFDNHNYNYN